jgi:hypothetical protein
MWRAFAHAGATPGRSLLEHGARDSVGGFNGARPAPSARCAGRCSTPRIPWNGGPPLSPTTVLVASGQPERP